MRRTWKGMVWAALLAACGQGTPNKPPGRIDFQPERPPLNTSREVQPYTGSDARVLEAQNTYRTGLDFHRKFIMRTCGPTNGVCHNQKEYPDMHTPAAFAATLGAACNVQPGSWQTVYDRCEQLGDRFRFNGKAFREIEIGWLEYIPGEYVDYQQQGSRPDATSPGLHLHLYEDVPLTDNSVQETGVFIRTFVNAAGDVEDLVFTSFNSRWWRLNGKHWMAEVRSNQVEAVGSLLKVGIIQGDMNRNGTYGARTGRTVPLLNPGKPEESYLVARMRGHMQGEPLPGTRMPLANQPPSIPDMVALMCFIQGANPRAAGWSLDWPIEYANCAYTANPSSLNLVGTGATWPGRIRPLLQTRCGGCHGGSNPQAGFDILAPDAYARLKNLSSQRPNLRLVEPGLPVKSYLWLKLSGDGSILGSRMPIDPLGTGQLSDAELADVQNWILAGALEDG